MLCQRAWSSRPRRGLDGYKGMVAASDRPAPSSLAHRVVRGVDLTVGAGSARMQHGSRVGAADGPVPPRRRPGRPRRSKRSWRRASRPLVAPDADRRNRPSPNRRGGLYDFMRRVLATDHGSQLYTRRQAVIRARLRSDQAQPRRRTLPTPRPLSCQIRMATVGGHPQHPQALAPQPRRGNSLTAARRAPQRLRRPAASMNRRPIRRGPLRNSHHGIPTLSPRTALPGRMPLEWLRARRTQHQLESLESARTIRSSARRRRGRRAVSRPRRSPPPCRVVKRCVGAIAVLDRLFDREAIEDRERAAPSGAPEGAGSETMSPERNRDD
jgi:hypothetical protein